MSDQEFAADWDHLAQLHKEALSAFERMGFSSASKIEWRDPAPMILVEGMRVRVGKAGEVLVVTDVDDDGTVTLGPIDCQETP